ncbi:kinase-like domain-containing protein [Parachaetomium inaequale]|uniref:Kinase-like domain-containing protein n=1 Tax=Parachaetomium inaequale TaxID=2588326 RepID=A0AAN6SNW8_9PEZI|nr:kinase-like domain-containing protein [Parachaetomium inaequale]
MAADMSPSESRNPYSFYPDPYSAYMEHESLYNYRPGGFHPIDLGDTLQDGRYVIRHKLGHGGFSTVWLARDTREQQWVSIKIKTAEASAETPDKDPEANVALDLERHYTSSAQAQEKPRCFARLLACFRHTGPNGTHNCLVTELLGPTVDEVLETFKENYLTLRPDTTLRASQQLLDAIAFVHQAGIAHGDISYSNVAFTCKRAMASEEDLFDAMGGEPTTVPAGEDEDLPPNLPRHMVQATAWPSWFEHVDEDICVLDWGLVFPKDKRLEELDQPKTLRVPETFFLDSFDYRHDLWRVGCVIYGLFYQQEICRYGGRENLQVREYVSKLGPLPASWQAKWEEMLKADPDAGEDESVAPPNYITETFEPRRRAIMSACADDEQNEYEEDEHTDHDYEALECLKRVIFGLLQYGPEKRVEAEVAASWIREKWTDYRRQEREEESEDEEGQDDRDEDSVAGSELDE